MGKADLHIHSNYSDGKMSVEAIINTATNMGLKYISITDHDNVEQNIAAAKYINKNATNIHYINGCEFSTLHNGSEVHIIGFFKYPAPKRVVEFIDIQGEKRLKRALKIMDKLKGIGIVINNVDEILHARRPGRLHIAKAMQRVGAVDNVDEAFAIYIGRGKPAYVPKEMATTLDVIDLIRENNGLAIIAHPFNIPDSVFLSLIEYVDGIEVFYPAHTIQYTEYLLNIANRNGLLISGGSDSHGVKLKNHGDIGSINYDSNYADNIIMRLK